MPASITAKITLIRWTAANLTLPVGSGSTAAAPWITNVDKINWIGPANGTTGINAKQVYTGKYGGKTPGGVLGTLVQGETYEVYTGGNPIVPWTLPTSIKIKDIVEGTGSSVPAPAITSFTPPSSVPNADLTITGTNLANAYAVVVNNVVCAISTNTSTSITAVINTAATTGTVKVYTAGGVAVSSTLLTVISVATLPAPPNGSATPTSSSTISVAASSVANATGYKLYVSATSNGTFTQLGGTLTSPVFSDTGLSAQQTRYYKWQAIGNGSTFLTSPMGTTFSGATTAAGALPDYVITLTNSLGVTTDNLPPETSMDWPSVMRRALPSNYVVNEQGHIGMTLYQMAQYIKGAGSSAELPDSNTATIKYITDQAKASGLYGKVVLIIQEYTNSVNFTYPVLSYADYIIDILAKNAKLNCGVDKVLVMDGAYLLHGNNYPDTNVQDYNNTMDLCNYYVRQRLTDELTPGGAKIIDGVIPLMDNGYFSRDGREIVLQTDGVHWSNYGGEIGGTIAARTVLANGGTVDASYTLEGIQEPPASDFNTLLYFPPAPGVTGNDAADGLTFISSSAMEVSVNNGPWADYGGDIATGNVNRPAGYWRARVKASTVGRRYLSTITPSPAFTAAALQSLVPTDFTEWYLTGGMGGTTSDHLSCVGTTGQIAPKTTFSINAGGQYKIVFEVSNYVTGSISALLTHNQMALDTNNGVPAGFPNVSGNGTHEIPFTAAVAYGYEVLELQGRDGGFTADFKVSVYLV
jgi:hypothetical protein